MVMVIANFQKLPWTICFAFRVLFFQKSIHDRWNLRQQRRGSSWKKHWRSVMKRFRKHSRRQLDTGYAATRDGPKTAWVHGLYTCGLPSTGLFLLKGTGGFTDKLHVSVWFWDISPKIFQALMFCGVQSKLFALFVYWIYVFFLSNVKPHSIFPFGHPHHLGAESWSAFWQAGETVASIQAVRWLLSSHGDQWSYPLKCDRDSPKKFPRLKESIWMLKNGCSTDTYSRWWFQRFFIFHPEPWGRLPFWLIFFNWVETTN